MSVAKRLIEEELERNMAQDPDVPKKYRYRHFSFGSHTACGFTGVSFRTTDPSKVTCANCKRTRVWIAFHLLKSQKFSASPVSSAPVAAENYSANSPGG